jgi:RNA polymerase sigma-70 factor (sigma-E family)
MTTATPLLYDDFEHFYLAHFRETAALAYSYTADLAEAQDIAQETFCRAWARWGRLARYDNPAAWVRRVAFHLAHSRWRRVRTAASYLVRQRVEATAETNPDHVAVVAALRKLPAAQREALVLHHLADLPIDEVAQQMQAPIGTVKSWLHRGRAAMSTELNIEVDLPAAPPVSEVARRSKRRRTAVTAGVLVLVVAGVLAVLQAVRSNESLPPVAPNPSPTGQVSATDPMRGIDWTHATIALSMPLGTFCPDETITMSPDGQGGAVWERPLLGDTLRTAFFEPLRIGLGDLNGDGKAEAAFRMVCAEALFTLEHLVVVERRADGTLHQIAFTPGTDVLGVWIRDGAVHTDHRNQEIRQIDRYRLDKSRLVLMRGSGEYLPNGLDLSPVAGQLPCTTLLADQGQPNYIELGRIGQPYLMLRYGCATATPTDVRLVIFDQVDGVWVAKQAVPVPTTPGVSTIVHVSEEEHLWFGPTGDGIGYTWNGQAFVR